MSRYVYMDKIMYYLIIGLITLFSWLPLRIHYFISDILYLLVYKVFKYRLSVVTTNISRSFPDMDYKGIKQVTEKFYHSLCDTAVEAIWAYTHSRERVGELLELGGCDALNRAYGDGKSVLVVLGHQSNWELYTSLPDLKGHYGLNMGSENFYYIYKKMSNKVSDRIIRKIRERHRACVLVEKGNIARHLLKNRAQGGVYYFIADQYPDQGNGIELVFLNQSTKVITGPEELARKLSLPVVFFGIERVRRGLYHSEFVNICDDASRTQEGYVTREYIRLLEESILRDKSNWLWSHKRWKKLK